MKKEVLITDILGVQKMKREINIFNSHQKKAKVVFPNLSEEENTHLEGRLNKYYSACGCSQGRAMGVITILVYVVLVVSGVISISKLGIANTVYLYFGCSFITMLIGKVYGLSKARRAISMIIKELESQHTYNLTT